VDEYHGDEVKKEGPEHQLFSQAAGMKLELMQMQMLTVNWIELYFRWVQQLQRASSECHLETRTCKSMLVLQLVQLLTNDRITWVAPIKF
jgi:hypothetical protein